MEEQAVRGEGWAWRGGWRLSGGEGEGRCYSGGGEGALEGEASHRSGRIFLRGLIVSVLDWNL